VAVETSRRGPVLLIELRREEKRNAIDRATAEALSAALDELEDDPDLRAGVLAGTARVFSAGTDLTQRSSPATVRGGEYGLVRRRRRRPLVAAVEGPALGGGFELVLACDLVVASETATFGLPEVVRSLIPTCGGIFRGPRALPQNVARELLLTGEPLGAERAHQLGLVNRLVPAGRALDEAAALAARVAANGPVAVGQTMAVLEAMWAGPDGAGWAATDAALGVIARSEDAREGVTAFFERRPPDWKGR
jgi:enoyl-CoA hydratase/carnithine racemase